jgi:hypothetical protein
MIKHLLLSLLSVFLLSSTTFSQKINPVEFSSGFTIPVDIMFDEVDNMYVVEKRGKISIVMSDGTKLNEPFIDITSRVNSSANERGLLGLALHPNFMNNGYFYVNYTAGAESRISRFTRNTATTADPDSEIILLTVDQPFNNHNAGPLAFGPDGYLYVPFGDGGSGGDPGNRSQDPTTLLGKMLRIDVNGSLPYEIPATNPFLNSQDTLSEIWSLGLRNPWKFSFDQLTGDMYIADVGQNKWEEVSFEPSGIAGGINYGWRCYEGFETYNTSGCGPNSTYTDPVHVFFNDENIDGCSITGGYVYRGSDPYLYGKYIYGDYCSGKIWGLYRDECMNWQNEELYQINNQELSSFGQNNNGELFYAELGNGKIYKIEKGCKLTTNIEVMDVDCSGAGGSINVIPSEPDVTIEISGGSFTDLEAGQYDITVTNASGCVNYLCVFIESNIEFDYPDITPDDDKEICEGTTESEDYINYLEDHDGLMMNLYKDEILFIQDWDGILIFNETASYQIEFYDSICVAPLQELINVVVFSVPDLIIKELDGKLIATPGFTAYQWFADFVLIPNVLINTLDSFKTNTTYQVSAFTTDACNALSPEFIITNTKNLDWVKGLMISPNPTEGLIFISGELKQPTDIKFEVIDLSGKIIHQEEESVLYNINKKIDISYYKSGVYMINIISKNCKFTTKIAKK